MNEKPLPQLPTPKFTETIRGVPCITVTEHEHLMRIYALQAIAHATQPAEVTDEREAFEAEMRCEDVWGHRSLKKRPDGRYQNWQVDLMWDVWQARSILTMRPVQVPMTDDQRTASWFGSPVDASWAAEDAYNQGILDAEAHHSLTAQAKKETP